MNSNQIPVIVPKSKRFKSGVDTDILLPITLDVNAKELKEGDRNVILNLAELFNTERQTNVGHRLYGKIYPLFPNNWSGITNNTTIDFDMFHIDPWSAGTSSGYPGFKEFDLYRTDVPYDDQYKTNWQIYLSYVYDTDLTTVLTYQPTAIATPIQFLCSDGIPFYIKNVLDGGKRLVKFTCPVNHNLNVGEYIELQPIGLTSIDSNVLFQVYSVGDETFGSEAKIFNVVNTNFVAPPADDAIGIFKRIVNLDNSGETRSNYYIRKHKIITNENDYIISKCGFEQQIFPDKKILAFSADTFIGQTTGVNNLTVKETAPTYLYHFNPDINIDGYRDNLFRPLIELFVTTVLVNGKSYFDEVKYGYSFNFPYNFKDTIVESQIAGYSIPLTTGTSINGDWVEYNKTELIEKPLSSLFHKFGFNQSIFLQDTNAGYVYKVHNRIKVREMSSYIESGDITLVFGIPDYATHFIQEQTWKWRDILPFGFFDEPGNGVDNPFVNGHHYVKTDIPFYIKDQVNFFTGETIISTLLVDNCE